MSLESNEIFVVSLSLWLVVMGIIVLVDFVYYKLKNKKKKRYLA